MTSVAVSIQFYLISLQSIHILTAQICAQKKIGIYVPKHDFGTYIHIRKRKHCLVNHKIFSLVIRKEQTYPVAVLPFVP
jgi:hypothetical protein